MRSFILFMVLAGLSLPTWATTVTDAWMRAIPPGAPTGAAYVSLTNDGSEPIAVVAARSPWAERVEIHESQERDGMWRMRKLDALEIPAEGSVTMAPGGAHLMLFGVAKSPIVGDTLELELELSTGEFVPVTVTVRPMGATGPHHHH